MVLNRQADAITLCYLRGLAQSCQYFLKKKLPATRQWPPVSADLCTTDHSTHRLCSQLSRQHGSRSQLLRVVATSRQGDEETMFASIASHCCDILTIQKRKGKLYTA